MKILIFLLAISCPLFAQQADYAAPKEKVRDAFIVRAEAHGFTVDSQIEFDVYLSRPLTGGKHFKANMFDTPRGCIAVVPKQVIVAMFMPGEKENSTGVAIRNEYQHAGPYCKPENDDIYNDEGVVKEANSILVETRSSLGLNSINVPAPKTDYEAHVIGETVREFAVKDFIDIKFCKSKHATGSSEEANCHAIIAASRGETEEIRTQSGFIAKLENGKLTALNPAP